MISVFIHPIEPFLEIYYMGGRDMAGAMVVEAVEFKNSLNVPYIIYRLIINKSSEFMKKYQYFFDLSSKKVCFRHIV